MAVCASLPTFRSDGSGWLNREAGPPPYQQIDHRGFVVSDLWRTDGGPYSGLLLSTLFTLFLVPTFLSLAMDLRAWIGRVGRV